MLFFDDLTSSQQKSAYFFGEKKHYAARSLLIRQGENANGIHIILKGTVESVYYSESDRELCLATWGENDFVGAPHIFGDSQQQWSARSLTDTEILHLDQTQLSDLIHKFPDISICLIRALGRKGERYSELAQRLAFHTVQERLALTLIDTWNYANAYRMKINSLPIPSTLELSRSIGATRQAVGHAIRSLESQGLIRVERRRFLIPQISALKDFAGYGSAFTDMPDLDASNNVLHQ